MELISLPTESNALCDMLLQNVTVVLSAVSTYANYLYWGFTTFNTSITHL
jgi:hypothetical protein